MKKPQLDLTTEYERLCARIVELETQLPAEQHDSQTAHDLAERAKELRTMYRVSDLADRQDITLFEYLQELVAILPQGWQYTDDAYARVVLNGQVIASPNAVDTEWQLQSPIRVGGKTMGTITVGYLSPHPPAVEGPFLAEERSLINELAKRVGRFLDRKQAQDAQHQLAAIVESSENAILSATLDGVVISWNAAAERIFGYTAREMIGRRTSVWLTPSQAQEETNLLEKLQRGYAVGQFETKRCHKLGYDIDIAFTISPIRNGRGQIVGAATIAHDITNRKLEEAALQESEERFRLTFEQAAVGIAHVAPDGRFLRVNQKLCSITGYSAAELMARTFQDITHPSDLNADLEYVHQMLAGRRATYSMEKRYFRKSGSEVWVNLTVSLARDSSGQAKYFISVIEDISQRKQAEQSLSESEARYRGLFENSPIALWEQDFSAVKERLVQLREQGVSAMREYLLANTDVIAECISRVRLLGFNRANLELYGATTKEDLLGGLDRLIPPEGNQQIVEELVMIDEGRTSFVWEGVNRRLSGEPIHVRIHWSAAPGYESSLGRVLVSIEEIPGPSLAA